MFYVLQKIDNPCNGSYYVSMKAVSRTNMIGLRPKMKHDRIVNKYNKSRINYNKI